MSTTFEYPRYTYSDYKNWKEDWQLVNGFPLHMFPAAAPKHSTTIINLIYQGKLSLLKNSDCNCMLFSEIDWKINEETVVRPDFMVICGETKNDYLEFPPVLIAEVLSPSNIKTDRILKFELYREQGVKYYILADYLKETVEVYELIDNYYKQVEKSKFQLDKNCEIEFDFDKIWK
jgi:Uma2 family endonuclease